MYYTLFTYFYEAEMCMICDHPSLKAALYQIGHNNYKDTKVKHHQAKLNLDK